MARGFCGRRQQIGGLGFQREGGESMGIQYLEQGFHEALRELQMILVGLILEGVDIG